MKYPASNSREIKTPRDLAYAFRQGPYVWPGGYPMFLLLADGECLCWKCYRAEYSLVAGEIGDCHNTGWKPYGIDINWEDPDLCCAHCNDKIESAYGDGDDE